MRRTWRGSHRAGNWGRRGAHRARKLGTATISSGSRANGDCPHFPAVHTNVRATGPFPLTTDAFFISPVDAGSSLLAGRGAPSLPARRAASADTLPATDTPW